MLPFHSGGLSFDPNHAVWFAVGTIFGAKRARLFDSVGDVSGVWGILQWGKGDAAVDS